MFEVQTAFIYGWENCWTTTDKDGKLALETFSTREQAQKAIDELIADVKDAVSKGEMEEEYDPEDYRIVPL
ncbi:MAG TPA: hypothetical protein VNX68_12510 [Nitrosopumilaceae archaeon]|jgi:hypothetical protein|nr:hypothetical protein [Nitrosopumilaceae archaeon]